MPGLLDNCRNVSRMLSDGLDRELPLAARVRLRLHLLICAGCTRLARQLRFLRAASRSLVDRTAR